MRHGESYRSWLMIVVLAGLCPGCTAMRITHTQAGRKEEIPGVPFYSKKGACRQEIVWLEPIYNLSLAALIPDKNNALQPHPTGAVSLSRTAFQSVDVQGFVKTLARGPTDADTVLRAWGKVVAASDASVLSRDFGHLADDDRILAGRSATPVAVVDYSDRYYVNARVPLAGSANLDAKVAADGSLTEVSAQTQDTTLQTILSALPISTLITGALGSPVKGVVPTASETFQLTISVTGYRHTLARAVPYADPCPMPSDLKLENATEYKREDVTAAAKPSSDDKSPNNNSNAKAPPDGGGQTGGGSDKKP